VWGIVCIAPFDRDTRAVDWATGRLGYGHVALAGGETDDFGRTLVVDSSTVTGGVYRRPLLDVVRRSRFRVLELEDCAGCYGRALEHLGEPYDFRALVGFRPRAGYWTCSGLVHACLPGQLRVRVKPWRAGWSVAPNDIVRAFGGE
jgi:hypothetical protein